MFEYTKMNASAHPRSELCKFARFLERHEDESICGKDTEKMLAKYLTEEAEERARESDKEVGVLICLRPDADTSGGYQIGYAGKYKDLKLVAREAEKWFRHSGPVRDTGNVSADDFVSKGTVVRGDFFMTLQLQDDQEAVFYAVFLHKPQLFIWTGFDWEKK